MYVLYELFFFIDNVVCLLSYEHVRLSCVFYSKLTYLLPYLLTYPNRNSNVNFFYHNWSWSDLSLPDHYFNAIFRYNTVEP